MLETASPFLTIADNYQDPLLKAETHVPSLFENLP